MSLIKPQGVSEHRQGTTTVHVQVNSHGLILPVMEGVSLLVLTKLSGKGTRGRPNAVPVFPPRPDHLERSGLEPPGAATCSVATLNERAPDSIVTVWVDQRERRGELAPGMVRHILVQTSACYRWISMIVHVWRTKRALRPRVSISWREHTRGLSAATNFSCSCGECRRTSTRQRSHLEKVRTAPSIQSDGTDDPLDPRATDADLSPSRCVPSSAEQRQLCTTPISHTQAQAVQRLSRDTCVERGSHHTSTGFWSDSEKETSLACLCEAGMHEPMIRDCAFQTFIA